MDIYFCIERKFLIYFGVKLFVFFYELRLIKCFLGILFLKEFKYKFKE